MDDPFIISESSSDKIEKKSNDKKEEEENNEEERKDIYFIIIYPRKQQEKPEDFFFCENDLSPQEIYSEETENENGIFFYKKVFQFFGETNNKYNLDFEINKDYYTLTFEVKDNSFVYDVELKKGNKVLKKISNENVDQKIIDYHEKLFIFLETLKKDNKEEEKETLFKDTINLFGEKKCFSLLISLFVQIYKNKNLCLLLMEKFKEMNNKTKDNEQNIDRNKDLDKYIQNFNDISSEANNLINSNNYDPIQFYGIILCYLNYFDNDNFQIIFRKLFEEKSNVSYEILLIYFSYFSNPINQNIDFFVKFIDYSLTKNDYKYFEIGLNYIRDIETFIVVIEKTKETIFEKFINTSNCFQPIKLKASLENIKKEKNEEMSAIIDAIKSINNYSKQNKVLLVYFSSYFWIKLLKDNNIVNTVNIKNCYELRQLLFEYNDLVNELYEKDEKSEIKIDVNKYFDRDEYAFILDKNIKKLLDDNIEKKELSNSELLTYVAKYNPYYTEDKYSYKRDTYIFDYISLDDNDQKFIEAFKKLDFETIFKDKTIEFLNKIISKIKNISNFGIILEIIDIKKISEIDEFFTQIKNKYENIKIQIDSLTDNELNQAVKVLAKFFDLVYIHEKSCNFMEKKINELDKRISSLIYKELMRICEGDEYKEMKEFIYSKYLNKLENVDNIIDFIDGLDSKDKITFLEKLMKKCQFTKEEYYSKNENKKIDLLYELNEKGKLEKNDEHNYYGEIEKIIQQINDDLNGEIIIKKLEDFLENEEKLVKKRLGLIKIIDKNFDPEKKYEELNNIIRQVKKPMNRLNLIKNINEKNIKDLTNEVKMLRKENEELSNEVKALKEKLNNVVLLVPGEHSQWDKKCPYCNSSDIKKRFAFWCQSWHSGVSGQHIKFYLHHFCNTCKKRFFAPDNDNWTD